MSKAGKALVLFLVLLGTSITVALAVLVHSNHP